MGYPWEKNPEGFPKIEGNFIYFLKDIDLSLSLIKTNDTITIVIPEDSN